MTASRPIGSGNGATITSAAGGARRLEGDIHVGDEIAGALGAERIWHGRLEAEQRHRADGRLQKLRGRAARCRRHGGDDLFGALAAEGGKEAGNETIDIVRSDIDVGGIVLRSNRNGRGQGCGTGLRGG